MGTEAEVGGPEVGGPAVDWPALPAPLVMPSYGASSLDSLVPALLEAPGQRPAWLPGLLGDAAQVVLLTLDGLGWRQLQDRLRTAPRSWPGLEGGPISSVAPTTTAAALTSLTLGMPPAAHGIVGYKFAVAGPSGTEVLNVLRWSTRSGDARPFVPPRQAQPRAAFGGRPVPVVSRSDFSGSGFSQAHQQGAREVSWTVPSSLPLLVGDLLDQGETFVYAYYEGIDKVAHASGLGHLYDAELGFVDRLVGDVISVLPRGAALAVTSDHGQVDVGAAGAPAGARGGGEYRSGQRRGAFPVAAQPARRGHGPAGARPAPLRRGGLGGQPGRGRGGRAARGAVRGGVPGPPGRCRPGPPGRRRLPGPH